MSNELNKAIAHIEEAHKILVGISPKEEPKKEPKNKKVKIEIKVKNPYDGLEIPINEMEQIRKDLEEIINDITGE